MFNSNVEEYLSIVTTSVTGMLGAISGDPWIQAASFIPAIIYKITTDISNKTNSGISKEFESLTKKVITLTYNELKIKNKAKANIFFYSMPSLNKYIENIISYQELLDFIKKELKNAAHNEAIDLTSNDFKEIVNTFIATFIKEISNYKKVNNIFLLSTLINHESRLISLEKNIHQDYSLSNIFETQVKDDSKYYCEKYNEPLFLHRKRKNSTVLTLKDVYVHPEAIIKSEYNWYSTILDIVPQDQISYNKIEYTDIIYAIKDFITYIPKTSNDLEIDILFIEGKAAMGKSSLISWFAWHCLNVIKDNPVHNIIGNSKMIFIKLRDIPSSYGGVLNVQYPFKQLCAYLLKTDENNLASNSELINIERKIFKDKILVLDGFDELCMLEAIIGIGRRNYFQNLYNELRQMDCNCKVIVTSRPEYLNVEKLRIPNAHIEIGAFTPSKRKKWLDKYEKLCTIDSQLKKKLIKDSNNALAGIIDSPLTIYMIVARNIHISDKENLWNIYNTIFSKELYERNYEKGVPHAINEYKDLLFKLTTEIANAVSKEKHFSISVDKLLDIKQIRKLIDDLKTVTDNNTKTILEDCFGLASYFRISDRNDEKGKLISSVEFYHNNIKDYFICEYIWLHLEEIYSNIPTKTDDIEMHFISCFQKMFQNAVYLNDSSEGVRSQPLIFIESKVLYLKEKNRQCEFIIQELKQRYFQRFFSKMLKTGFLFDYNYSSRENIMNMMSCIYSSVISIYHTIYVPYLDENECLSIAEDEDIVDISTSFIFRILFLKSNIKNLCRINFDGLMLSGISFNGQNFQNSSFKGCLLLECDFSNCDLRGADFSAASLQRANLKNAIIDETTIFSKETKFEKTIINKDDLHFFTKWTKVVNLNSESIWINYISDLL